MSKVAEPLFGSAIGPWRQWFAWRPVQTFDDIWVWLRPVRRRRYQSKLDLPGSVGHWWLYALPEDVI
jgi:hypothetical protein